MLRKNPKGGRPMQKYSRLVLDTKRSRMMYKWGYCECGQPIYVTRDEIKDIVMEFYYIVEDELQPTEKAGMRQRIGEWLMKDKGLEIKVN